MNGDDAGIGFRPASPRVDLLPRSHASRRDRAASVRVWLAITLGILVVGALVTAAVVMVFVLSPGYGVAELASFD